MSMTEPRKAKARGIWERLRRLWRYRLVIPLKRSRHSPEHDARGVAIGLAWALTPTNGIQLGLVAGTWLILRRWFRWDFNLVIAMAWTWATNFLTLLPCYYAFYVTGQVFLGRWEDLAGYQSFQQLLTPIYNQAGAAEAVHAVIDTVVWQWGLAMVLGCIPYSLLGGWLGYVFGLKIARRLRSRRGYGRSHHLESRGPSGGGSPA